MVSGSTWWGEKWLFKPLSGAVDERGQSLLGELSLSRLFPSYDYSESTGVAGTDAQTDTVTRIAAVAAKITAAVAVGLAAKSVLQMALWRHRLRDASTEEAAAGPAPLPVLGNILELRSNYYRTLYQFVDKPAAVFWIMSTPFVVINDEGCLRRVLGGAGGRYVKPKYFGYRSKPVQLAVDSHREKVAAESVDYADDGDASRKALSNLVESSFDRIKTSMTRLTGALADASERVDIEDHHKEALAAIRESLVGLNLNVLFGLEDASQDSARFARMIEFAGAEFARRMVNPFRVLFDIPGNLRYLRDVGGLIGLGRKLCKKLDETFLKAYNSGRVAYSNVQESIGNTDPGLGWVHAWVGKVGKFGKLGKVIGLLMASSQTVPITAVWLLHLVAKHDNVRERLLRELHELGIQSAADLRFEHLEKMPLADAVICETLRLYPPFPLIQRQAQIDDVLGNITVPAGTIVYVVPWLVHRNPKFWRSPHEFDPGRFTKMNSSHGDAPSDWVYLPFGRGPRMCAGSRLAMVELKVLLALALLQFQWSTVSDKAENDPYPELGMIPKGIRLFFRRVKHEMDLQETM